MPDHSLIHSIFLIFAGAALLATVALYARQSMLVAYIFLGFALGPWGMGLADDIEMIEQMSQTGIIFLLFLLGLNLEPKELLSMLKSTTIVTLMSALVFSGVGYLIAKACGFSHQDAFIMGLACLFSSTIIGLKLLPATALHHQHMGEIMVSVLLLQDLIAIMLIVAMQSLSAQQEVHPAITFVSLPLLIGFAFLFSRYVLHKLLLRFDSIQEYIFLVTIGWCLSVATLSSSLGLSLEIGAFIGGVSLAISPIARFIAESLRPLRDFFLVMFFFSLGAKFNFSHLSAVIVPAGLIAVVMLFIKPFVFKWLLHRQGERNDIAMQSGVRLGQISEFSLLVALVAVSTGLLSEKASYTLQLATIISFIFSSYWIVVKYPTPISTNEKLRMD